MAPTLKEGDLVEILHDTGGCLDSADTYAKTVERVRVGTNTSSLSSEVHVVWAWEEDQGHVGNHDPNNVLPGTSFVKYEERVASQIEEEYEWHQFRKNYNVSKHIFTLDLSSSVKKSRNNHTGLEYKFDFENMRQINTKSSFSRSIRREVHFKTNTAETVKNLPGVPSRKFPTCVLEGIRTSLLNA